LVGLHSTNRQKKATCVAPKFSSWHTDSYKIYHALRYAFTASSAFQCAMRVIYRQERKSSKVNTPLCLQQKAMTSFAVGWVSFLPKACRGLDTREHQHHNEFPRGCAAKMAGAKTQRHLSHVVVAMGMWETHLQQRAETGRMLLVKVVNLSRLSAKGEHDTS